MTNIKYFVMLVGAPGSGKSTYRERETTIGELVGAVVLSTDDFIEARAKEVGLTYNEAFPLFIKAAEKNLEENLQDAISRGAHIIWDQTNMSQKSRAKKLSKIPMNYEKWAVAFEFIDINTLIERNKNRVEKTIPRHIIQSMLDNYQKPTRAEGFDRVITHLECR